MLGMVTVVILFYLPGVFFASFFFFGGGAGGQNTLFSAHNLMVEKGRHLNLLKKDRNCPICNMGLIENEQHVLLHCKEYKSKRSVLLSKINSTFCIITIATILLIYW